MELNINRWMESEAYQKQKEVIAREANNLLAHRGDAPITLASPNRTTHIDYTVFRKSAQERAELATHKASYKEYLKRKALAA